MSAFPRFPVWCLACLLAAAPQGMAQRRPYIGFVYPAGGRQGSTFEVRLGGQDLADVHAAIVSGGGVTARVVSYERRLGPQDVTLLREQLEELKASLPKPPPPPVPPKPAAKAPPQGTAPAKPAAVAPLKPPAPAINPAPPAAKPPQGPGPAKPPPGPPPGQGAAPRPPAAGAAPPATSSSSSGPSASAAPAPPVPGANAAAAPAKEADPETLRLIAVIEKRIATFVAQPAVQSVANLAFVEVTIAADAAPGDREIRLLTPQGVSNPLVFQVGQLPEHARKPMNTSAFQVLGKEELAKRKRPPEEAEVRVDLPCTVNGQVASGEVNLYRFAAKRGQRLVFATAARCLVPYIADAVPGWFQPVLRLCDAAGHEVAYDDDFRFSPDPAIFYQVPADGEYVLSIYDGIFRGREDFVYRIVMGELPFVTHVSPLGGQAGGATRVAMKGWNLDPAQAATVPADAAPGLHWLAASAGKLVSNRVPFVVDALLPAPDREPNDGRPQAQPVTLPAIVDGRVDRPGDLDVFEFSGRAGETVVAEVMARRLGSPADAALALTDAAGVLLDFNDDSEDLGSGLNTHHADSYLMTKLPADGTYRVTLTETSGNGGEEYGYRLRLGAPVPDFELRVVPSSLAIRGKSSNRVTVHAIRKDGFREPIKLALKDPPPGFSAPPVTLAPYQDSVSFSIKADLTDTGLRAVDLAVEGRATVDGKEIARPAVPAEDRMQAFLWRHLVPAGDFKVLVFDPAYQVPRTRVPPAVKVTSR